MGTCLRRAGAGRQRANQPVIDMLMKDRGEYFSFALLTACRR
ncbi:hypothetical protein OV450_0051 [Actinobacteria bacterium OV450]|nr:hypothetical protein OV450_0051 [Actinobacteria bacterium OV450]